ncbi:hypothetical protein A3742_11425 [Oleiphilus sp. HI0071]|uniref:8-amino-7-oxononanoate synthase n=1 Tax=Oleiphilus sp. HI0080 TaxID=1822255 RepID=UPI0007C33CD7|nr:8-amino-7-oxononanoate synthase [Oleiphilus sp. HI0080]KZY61510.1 hypothetical protein A3737_21660 [Oleiphilus sp. HI0065]KZY81587.1 hypothetical protein A3742_11425 [Oleiphilus sp. HI0071]KZZ03760.1 hypothetical protein A3744_10610 [Oleiphilus sp. HI0073]KZZ52063.1 hypothetical protein A3760_11005 [Oleiphilus sp. HI0122]KZZ82333.1 hypothetical protein A3767_04775 [Oleiphilus sp. HI0133]
MAYERLEWESKLSDIENAGLLRSRRTIASSQGPSVSLSGFLGRGARTPSHSRFRNFASNDYLGFADHPQLKEAALDALNKFGLGSGSSDVVCGHFEPHDQLEQALAKFTGRDKALLFSSGYMANLAVSNALCDPKSLILQDKLNHASLIDGAKLSGARSQRYLHSSIESLDSYLTKFSTNGTYGQKLIITDGVFSMDGDVAPLGELAKLADQFSALLAVDDAHGLGVLGEGGRGSVAEAGLSQEQCPLLIGTFGKAFGTFGAFVAGPKALMEVFEQRARSHIYTTALPPAIAAATNASLHLVEQAGEQRAHLQSLIEAFHKELAGDGFELLQSRTAIQGVVIGANESVMRTARFLEESGLLVGAIRPPTVSPGSSRLRITLTATHTMDDLDCLVTALRKARDLGCLSE